jgi:glycosyltransferase involved in cell wall biosynthesis
MRICILTTSFPLYKGVGPGVHVIEKARHLVRLGVEVDVLAPHHSGTARYEVIDGIHVYRVRYVLPERWQTLCYGAGILTNLKKNLWTKLQLPLLLVALFLNTVKLTRKSDLIHAHWSLAGLLGVLVGKLLGKPVVVMIHRARVDMFRGNPIIKFVLEHADYVLCNSSFTLSKVLEVSRPRVYKVISPAVDIERFQPDVDLSIFHEREPDIPKDRPLVFSLGRLIEWKGFTHLIDAIALLSEVPVPYLIIGGHGPLREQLQRRVQDKRIANRVKFLGYIPNEYTPAYYSAADVFVLPSVVDERGDTEGLGVVLLEALACKTPCVASNVGGIPDVITDGLNGFLVEPGNPKALADKILQLITNDKLRQEMGVQGRLFVEKHFSWQAKAHEIFKVYQVLLREREDEQGSLA